MESVSDLNIDIRSRESVQMILRNAAIPTALTGTAGNIENDQTCAKLVDMLIASCMLDMPCIRYGR